MDEGELVVKYQKSVFDRIIKKIYSYRYRSTRVEYEHGGTGPPKVAAPRSYRLIWIIVSASEHTENIPGDRFVVCRNRVVGKGEEIRFDIQRQYIQTDRQVSTRYYKYDTEKQLLHVSYI